MKPDLKFKFLVAVFTVMVIFYLVKRGTLNAQQDTLASKVIITTKTILYKKNPKFCDPIKTPTTIPNPNPTSGM